MSDNKKYYYLKLKDSFYNTEDIKLLESMANGYEYSSLYLKLCLLSLKGEGELLYKNRIPYKPEMLSTITGHQIEVIKYAIDLFVKLEMITILDNGTIFIDDIQNLIGHGSTEAERKSVYRKKLKDMKLLGHCPDKRPPEKEKDIEIEKEKKKKPFIPPSLDEVKQFCIEKNLIGVFDYEKWFRKFTVSEWKDGKGKPVKNWKLTLSNYTAYDTYLLQSTKETKYKVL